ncbi:hypothetical protein [Bacillus velezensis]|uniref:hypothetical protein n=1 Tax=Bacillus velezensis TaxID=492670 RepID=UPI001EE9B3D5|nr:hypothetical protein [Bacillus velezensis]
MKHIIKSLEKAYRLYKQPHKIGDLIEFQQKQWIIIGIEAVSIDLNKLRVIYTVQNAEEVYAYQPPISDSGKTVEIIARVRTGKEAILEKIQVGRLVWIDNKPYQSVGFIDIDIEFTDVVITFLGRPVRPIPIKEVRAKVLNERKKKLNLQVL